MSVAGIPKTIDNDLDIIDRSFGFLTSVEVKTALNTPLLFEDRTYWDERDALSRPLLPLLLPHSRRK